MTYTFLDFFTDPLLRAPMLGSMILCAALSLLGVFVFVRRSSLIGETLSHAAYPGLMIGATWMSTFMNPAQEEGMALCLLFAFGTTLLALMFVRVLQRYIKSDAALCFTLASFFGVGVLFGSRLQFTYPSWYRAMQVFLYGQTATLLDVHVMIYAIFLGVVLVYIALFYHKIQMVAFDPLYAKSLKVSLFFVDKGFWLLLALGITLAMKSVGVVLISGMLVAPALGARRCSTSLIHMLLFGCLLGTISAFTGNYLSVKCTEWISERLLLPTGPLIVLCSALCALGTLVKKGDVPA